MIALLVILFTGSYFVTQKTQRPEQLPLKAGGAIPCSYVFKTKSDYSGMLTVGYYNGRINGIPLVSIKKLYGDYYYTVYGCNIAFYDHTVVTKLTYSGGTPPDSEIIRKSIIDYDPFTEVYECKAKPDGKRSGSVFSEQELREIFKSDTFIETCTKVK
jgi:hypothetical protein